MARNALRQPTVWIAVLVLLVNDHLLKGSGIIDATLTGKLSDFSWLIVAPVFAGALFGLERRASIAALISLISLVFVVTELSQPAADGLCLGLGRLGLPSRLWADPTDLIALSVLPVTWHVMTHSDETGADRLSAPLNRMGIGLGIFASLATTNPPPPNVVWTTGAFAVNRTDGPIQVRIRWTSAAIDCEALEESPLDDAISSVIFDEAITYELDANDTVPLERADPGAPTAPPRSTGRCQLALVAMDGAPDTVVLVPGTAVAALVTQSADSLDVPGRAVVVSRDGLGFDIDVGSDLSWGLIDDRARASDCTDHSTYDIAWSHGPRSSMVTARSVGADGCIILTLDGEGRAFVCVPAELVPYEVGDTISFDDRSSSPTGHRVRTITGPGGALTVTTTSAVSVARPGDVTVSLDAPEACMGRRLPCGAYALPFRVSVTATEGPIASLADGVLRSSGGTLVALGRSQRVVIAPTTCDPAHSRLGATLEFAALTP